MTSSIEIGLRGESNLPPLRQDPTQYPVDHHNPGQHGFTPIFSPTQKSKTYSPEEIHVRSHFVISFLDLAPQFSCLFDRLHVDSKLERRFLVRRRHFTIYYEVLT